MRKSLVVFVVVLAGCGGGSKKQPVAVATAHCLNDGGFLVQAQGRTVEGTSPSGVGFTLTLAPGRPAAIDASGNPSSAKLTRGELGSIRKCLGKAVH
jgi:hypothetical protein